MVLIIICLLASLWLWPAGLGAVPGAAPGPPTLAPGGGEAVRFPYYRLPEQLYLCGEPVPLDDPAVREELDREFTLTLWSRAQTTMWLKRASRYFPEIEARIRAHRLPLDLKCVVLVESDLRPKAKSPAGAAGPWQFMAPTAQRFQLKSNDNVDERLEFTGATEAALNYLEKLYQIFHNWALALAAYNAGEGRVEKAIAVQGVNNFYYLSLPEETERYVHRVLAAKLVLEDPAAYGYDIPPDQLYPPLTYEEVLVTFPQEVTVRQMAEACGTYFKAFKNLNPWIKGNSLVAGTYRLKVPQGSAARFQAAYRQGQMGPK